MAASLRSPKVDLSTTQALLADSNQIAIFQLHRGLYPKVLTPGLDASASHMGTSPHPEEPQHLFWD